MNAESMCDPVFILRGSADAVNSCKFVGSGQLITGWVQQRAESGHRTSDVPVCRGADGRVHRWSLEDRRVEASVRVSGPPIICKAGNPPPPVVQ